ncbi:GrpB family protein [Vibrio lentus]|uniref:GrpB family protein n=1 Tax=Vibrio lentus TaxID=136468 RepID=A0AA44VX92_9VIBR|nr:GrpB family protein [Vibrio lentus]MCB5360951.1 GrpB family protein [Vibrio lentus]MCB5451827.1 GrpB family protein [Vibrio lentus]MCB5462686.1 GrpB family protein [Vibrio lentus]MCC4792139.1 GrpB family protein [Vibrio lentus]MCC4850165.1 GrpB family protein [Vibrio lentus]
MKFYSAEQYQAACNKLFVRYERDIKKLIPNARIEYVGASSIPFAVSKGDLDIFVGIESSELEYAVEQLTTLGFKEKLDTLRTPELCMLESTSGDDVALQVVANGSEFECFLRFRDKLRANPALVEQYNTLKMSCEGWSQDEYREKKSTFIEHVLVLK